MLVDHQEHVIMALCYKRAMKSKAIYSHLDWYIFDTLVSSRNVFHKHYIPLIWLFIRLSKHGQAEDEIFGIY